MELIEITVVYRIEHFIYVIKCYIIYYEYNLSCPLRCTPHQEEVFVTVEMWRLGKLDPAALNTTRALQLLWRRYSALSMFRLLSSFFHEHYCSTHFLPWGQRSRSVPAFVWENDTLETWYAKQVRKKKRR